MKTTVLRWDGGVAVGSEYNEGFLTVQPDFYGEEASGGEGGIVQHPFGFLGRPADPDDEGSCQALYAYEGDQLHILPTQDTRALAKIPELKKGGSAQYDSAGSFGSFDPETHTYTLYVPVAFDAAGTPTKAHAITVGRAADETPLLSLVHADGAALLMQGDAKHSVILKNKSGSASILMDDDGQIALAGIARLASGVAAGSPAAVPLARAPELIAWATLVTAAVNALVAKVNALVPAAPVTPITALPASVAATLIKSD